MRIPSEKELQELWVSSRVDQYQREHRPHPDYSLFIAEFKEAVAKIKADAWDEGAAKGASVGDLAISLNPMHANPYRKQEEV